MNVKEAARVLCEALRNDKELLDAAVASVDSAIRYYKDGIVSETSTEKLSLIIVRRLIGDE